MIPEFEWIWKTYVVANLDWLEPAWKTYGSDFIKHILGTQQTLTGQKIIIQKPFTKQSGEVQYAFFRWLRDKQEEC